MNLKVIFLFLFFLFCNTFSVFADDVKKYIEEYKHLAISEMERTGVPASIKLAQAILESNSGKSELARKAKNHFGIKCGNTWYGKKYYSEDDDRDENGWKIKSCFRAYDDPTASFMAHSDFLVENYRYRKLFEFNPLDYKKWAKGLKEAGYATASSYDKKLIKIIEQYELDRYDRETSSDSNSGSNPVIPSEIIVVNDAKMVFAKENDTPLTIAQRTQTTIGRILSYNENLKSKDQILKKDERVFLQKKRNNFRGKESEHIVIQGETMYDIAQNYDLKLQKLYKKNKMQQGTEPLTGEKIVVRGKAKSAPRLREKNPVLPPPPVLIEETKPKEDQSEEKEELLELEEVETTPQKEEPKEKEKPVEQIEVIKVEEPQKEELPLQEMPPVPVIEEIKFHVVQKGETLWSISQKYKTTVDAIMQLNNLNSKIISIGMKLRVE